ncbi:MAG: hydroxymethylglutaryl-CoA lyase [Bacteroidetes bacterium]|nr:hydroxymethylglutaryl-CoA lyase [Bacteroidota bacterium]
MIKITECPRDAMQGIHTFIPTELKTEYLNKLLAVGFDTLDFGSFVSPKAIPQLQDTAEVLASLDLSQTQTKLLAIIANPRGAEAACSHREITYLGYPFSISETFQQRNTNRGITDAFEDVKIIQDIALKANKELLIYISMGFGNPYGDHWNAEIVGEWVTKIQALGVKIFSLSDTIGAAQPQDISPIFTCLINEFPHLEFGAHFHSTPAQQMLKLKAAYMAGVRRYDAALLGFGGCPMAADALTGNINTLTLLDYLNVENEDTHINYDALTDAIEIASERVFGVYQ